jgi:hypothetical protein
VSPLPGPSVTVCLSDKKKQRADHMQPSPLRC